MRIRTDWTAAFLIVGACAVIVTCGGGSTGGNATPTAVAVNTATPAPTASPSPIPGLSCGLPPVGNNNPSCARRGNNSDMIEKVEVAISQLQASRPDIFSGDHIKDLASYRHGVTRNLEAMGLCVLWDADEIGVKFSNDFSEHFHIDTSSSNIQRGSGVYRLTCEPAAFPISGTPIPPRGDCSLPSSIADGCGPTDTHLFADVMDATYSEIAKDRPELLGADGKVLIYSPADHTGNNRPIFKEFNLEIAKRLRAKGFCVSIDETLINLKSSNDLSEWYEPVHEGPPFPERRNDHDPKTGFVQAANVGYQGICRPAVF
jgi:hypothetical protein